MFRKIITLSGLCAVGFMGSSGVAQAGLEFCNESSNTQSVSIGYRDLSNGEWTSEGWWVIEPGNCARVIGDDLTNRYYYYRATVDGGGFEDEGYYFCTDTEAYTIVGDEDCEARGYRRQGFNEFQLDEGITEYTLTLVDPDSIDQGSNNQGSGDGFLGEPYTVQAIFQGCSFNSDEPVCYFHAEGFKWHASTATGTGLHIINDLADLQVGVFLEVTGELITFADITTQATIDSYSVRRANSEAENMMAGLQGRWSSLSDNDYVIELEGSEAHEFYDERFQGTSFVQVADSCDDSNGAGPVLILTEPDDHQNPRCFVVRGWDAQFLQLTAVGAAGSGDQSYRRKF